MRFQISGPIRRWSGCGIRASNGRPAIHSWVSGNFQFFLGLEGVRCWNTLVFFLPQMTGKITDRTSSA